MPPVSLDWRIQIKTACSLTQTGRDGDHSYSIPEFYDAERILSSPPLGKERSG